MWRTHTIPQDHVDAVGRGAIMLDRLLPGWHRHINVKIIDLTSGEDCILGQLWYALRDQLEPWEPIEWSQVSNRCSSFGSMTDYIWDTRMYSFSHHSHGFMLNGPYAEPSHTMLIRAWKQEIANRLAKDAATPIPVLEVVPEYVLTA